MAEFETYKGLSPEEACMRARKNGLQFVECIRMLRSIWEDLDFKKAKEIFVRTEGFGSLEEYQEKVILPLAQDYVRLRNSQNPKSKN